MTDNQIMICGHGSGNPSKKNLHDYCTTRYNQKAPNGKRKGIVAVRRWKGGLDANEFRKNYNTIIGRNIYNQGLRQYVYTKYKDGKYYSDCSSSGMATIKKITKSTCDLYNTAGIYTSSRFETVPVKISNGHITNPEILQPGDAILFVGSDASRPKQIGHVEWVHTIPGTNCKSKGVGVLYSKPDQTAKHLDKFYLGDMLRVLDDLKDGWSEVIFDGKTGYVKNIKINRVGKSSYPKAKVNKAGYVHKSNSGTSSKLFMLEVDDTVQVVTRRSRWSYVKIGTNKGWFPTSRLTF